MAEARGEVDARRFSAVRESQRWWDGSSMIPTDKQQNGAAIAAPFVAQKSASNGVFLQLQRLSSAALFRASAGTNCWANATKYHP
jgi:hypothetical protein